MKHRSQKILRDSVFPAKTNKQTNILLLIFDVK